MRTGRLCRLCVVRRCSSPGSSTAGSVDAGSLALEDKLRGTSSNRRIVSEELGMTNCRCMIWASVGDGSAVLGIRHRRPRGSSQWDAVRHLAEMLKSPRSILIGGELARGGLKMQFSRIPRDIVLRI